MCTSPSKTFNLSGISASNFIIQNAALRERFIKMLKCLSLHNLSPFAIDSLIAAYMQSEDWVDKLTSYLEANRDYAIKFIKEELPLLKVSPCEGTYLLWVDMSALPYSSDELMYILSQKAKIWVNEGRTYGKDSSKFIRINFALPKDRLAQALNQLKLTLGV